MKEELWVPVGAANVWLWGCVVCLDSDSSGERKQKAHYVQDQNSPISKCCTWLACSHSLLIDCCCGRVSNGLSSIWSSICVIYCIWPSITPRSYFLSDLLNPASIWVRRDYEPGVYKCPYRWTYIPAPCQRVECLTTASFDVFVAYSTTFSFIINNGRTLILGLPQKMAAPLDILRF